MMRKKIKLDTASKALSTIPNDDSNLSRKILELEDALSNVLFSFKFEKPVTYVYNPLKYANKPHAVYTEKYCKFLKDVLFVGMNPGPWGMCQTGVPFGEINAVKDWFEIEEPVDKPDKECPNRLILGFKCTQSEVSGKRLWGLFRELCGIPDNFFKHCFVYNYCPLAFMKDGGANVTPNELKSSTQKELEKHCDETLFEIIQLLQVKTVVGIGRYVEKRAQEILKKDNPLQTKVLYMPHPSPRVVGNTNWTEKARDFLDQTQLSQYLKKD